MEETSSRILVNWRFNALLIDLNALVVQIVKDKLNASQSKMLEYERKINYLEAKIVELQRSVHERSQGSDTSRADASSEQNQLAVSVSFVFGSNSSS